jgi:uncharacterized oxidoreductase
VPVVNSATLHDFSAALFVAAGVSPESAEIVSRSLIGANLRGHDSHGVMRIPFYINAVKTGKVSPGETLRVERETPAALTCDGGWGLGQVLVYDLMQRLIEKARTCGIAAGTLRRAAHIGRLGEYAELAAAQGFSAIIIANSHGSGLRVAPVGGKRGRLGTNPICIGIPGGADGPFILDFGTSATAEGKVRVKKIAGQPVPLGWILDSDGKPTTDPNTLYGDPPGSILPMGGDQAYKGFGLAYMIELLCGGFSGSPCSFAGSPPPMGNSAMFLVLSPEQFSGLSHLNQEVSALEKFVRETPRRDGCDQITLPGDPERNTLHDRQSRGIPLDDGNWQPLVKLAGELNVPVPNLP